MTAIVVNTGGRTVSTVVPLTPLSVAVISDEPAVLPVASPPLVIVATDRLPEVQLTWLVRSAVLVSEYVPVALNCCVAPTPIDGLAGVIASDTKDAVPVLGANTTSTQ